MEPPIHTEYLRSGGAMILTFMDEGARAVISFFIRSERPGVHGGPSRLDEEQVVSHVPESFSLAKTNIP